MGKRKSTQGTGLKPSPTDGETKSKYFCTEAENDPVSSKAAPSTTKNETQSKTDGRLQYLFYDKPCVDLAKALLGKVLVRKLDDGQILKGSIVETEAYLGGGDKAAHSYNGKRTAKNEAMFMDPGTSYVYHIYGLYTCVNISSQGDGAAVLIRGMDPIQGHATMKKFRGTKRADKGNGLKDKDLGSGPSKLTQALDISKNNGNQKDLTSCGHIWLEDNEEIPQDQIIESSRIGVDYAEEWAKKPLRFYVKGNQSVSVRDKKAEAGTQKTDETGEDKSQQVTPGTPKANKKGGGKAKERKRNDLSYTEENNVEQVDLDTDLHTGEVYILNDCLDSSSDSKHISDSQDSKYTINSTSLQQTGLAHCDRINKSSLIRLERTFFNKPCIQLAQSLLGKTIVRSSADSINLRGMIVETEAYLGTEDGCCHSFSGRPTPKTRAMFMQPGTAYVYHVYYSYYCFNISSQGEGAVVLVRSIMPLEGMDIMREARGKKRSDHGKKLKDHQLGNGPSKLCMALDINKLRFNEQDLVTCKDLWIENGCDISNEDIICSKRIGLKTAHDLWKNKPWRFYIRQNKSVSVIDESHV